MRKILFILLFSLPMIISGQGKVWTLDECVRYAVENNPRRIRQEAQNNIYRYNYQETVGSFIPSLSANTSVNFGFGLVVDDNTNTYVSRNTFGNNYGISSSLTLFDGLANVYRLKLAKLNRVRGKEELEYQKDMIAWETMGLFFNVIYHKEMIALAEKQLEESREMLRQAVRMEELGIKSLPDVAEFRTKEAGDLYNLTAQENALNQELVKLKTKMNLPIEDELLIADAEVDALIKKVSESALEVYQQALDRLPGALVAEKSYAANKMEYKITKSNLFPKLYVNAGLSSSYSHEIGNRHLAMSFHEQIKTKRNSYIGFSLSIPIVSNLSRVSSINRGKQNLIIAESQRDESLRQIYTDIEQTIMDVNSLSDQCIQSQRKAEHAETAYRLNQKKYEEGLLSAIDLTASSNRWLDARIEELRTRLNYQVKHKLLEYYQGYSLHNN